MESQLCKVSVNVNTMFFVSLCDNSLLIAIFLHSFPEFIFNKGNFWDNESATGIQETGSSVSKK